MPGLLPNTLSGFSATPSASRASTRGPPFTDQRSSLTDDASTNLHPSLAKAVRLPHFPALQAMGVQSRPLCADRRTTSTGRNIMASDCDSSGSEHDPSSVCLAAMVNEFIESEYSACSGPERTTSRDSAENTAFARLTETSNSLESLARCEDDLEINLLRDVQAIVEPSEEDHCSGSAYTDRKRMVMSALRRCGYNAAICKTKWDHSNGLSAGDYEFIDVLVASDTSAEPLRLLVDVEFQAQFEIARPLCEFSEILQLVPPIFVGRAERLQQIVRVMAEATKQSLRMKGMHLPPWRKLSYMLAKWFSAYKRTTNTIASSRSSHSRSDDVKDISGASVMAGMHSSGAKCVTKLESLYHGSKPWPEGSHGSTLRPAATTDWQPPPLEARSRAHTRSHSGAIGLTSMLLHTGIPIQNNAIANAA